MPLDRARIRGLCFDIDGTLSDSDDSMVNRLALSLTPFRWMLFGRTPAAVARRIMMGIEAPGNLLMGIPDRFGLDDELSRLVEAVNRRQLRRRQAAYLLIPGIRETLELLKPHYPMVVISARDDRTATEFLQAFELLPFFSYVITAQTCAHTKPYPDPLLWVGEHLGLAPSQLLMIGDTTVDIRAGKAAGAQTIGVLCGFGEEPELRRAGADLILPSTSLLPQILLDGGESLPSLHP
jgi:HAD superfamily hydrolase (TIGR01549 family)